MEFAYESFSPPPPSLPLPTPSIVCLCVSVCVYVRSAGIDEVLQECGDKAKAVTVRHIIDVIVCRCTDVHTYFIQNCNGIH